MSIGIYKTCGNNVDLEKEIRVYEEESILTTGSMYFRKCEGFPLVFSGLLHHTPKSSEIRAQ